MEHNDYGGTAFSREQPYIQMDVYPNHGAVGYDEQTYLTDLPTRLFDLGFSLVEDRNPADGGYAGATEYKRIFHGMVIYISVTPRNWGPNRVMHAYIDDPCADVVYLDLTAAYAEDLIRGRGNVYMFNAYTS